MPIPYSNTDLLQHALIGYEQRKEEIDQAIASIRSRLDGSTPRLATPTQVAPARKHHRFSAATRKRMALLMKQRWAKAKKAGRKRL